jgi:hypothetical protein
MIPLGDGYRQRSILRPHQWLVGLDAQTTRTPVPEADPLEGTATIARYLAVENEQELAGLLSEECCAASRARTKWSARE